MLTVTSMVTYKFVILLGIAFGAGYVYGLRNTRFRLEDDDIDDEEDKES